jgi:hypothetical protein
MKVSVFPHGYHGMAGPQVADEGDGLKAWRVTENILNKQSQTGNMRWSSSFGGLVWGSQLLTVKKLACYEMSQRALAGCFRQSTCST